MKLSFVFVDTWRDAESLRVVRNYCRHGMTHNTGEITSADQALFFKNGLKTGLYEAYLLKDGKSSIGYGLLKKKDDVYWMTAGLVPKYRGKGLSQLIINFITEMGHREGKEVYIDVHDDNLALYGDIRVGYEFVSSMQDGTGKVLHVMKHNRQRRLGPKEAQWMREHGRDTGSDIGTEMVEVDKIHREAYA